MTQPAITSTANPRVRAAAALRERAERDTTGWTLVDGGREVRRAIASGAEVVEAFVCRPLLRSVEAQRAVDDLQAARVPVVELGEAAFGRVAFGDRADGVVAVVHQPSTSLGDLDLPAYPLIVVLDRVEKPGNIGAIVRTADGAGADALVVSDAGTDLFNPNVIRASLGAIFRVPIAAASAEDVRRWLVDRGIAVVAARLDAVVAPWDVDLAGSTAILLGSEAAGLGAGWAETEVRGVRIPMRGIGDSLNVSVAAAVLLYEARRQRG